MNKSGTQSDRNKTLLLVEGKHEKSSLLRILLKAFPKIPVRYENIIIHGADIFDLYGAIEEEYGDEWYEDDLLEINIPYLISKRLHITPMLDRNRFTNIIMVFDYERQDPSFDFAKILRMQKHFNNVSEDGVLYINYPMVESYLDMSDIPCPYFMENKIPVAGLSGNSYKKQVCATSVLLKYIKLHDRVRRDIDHKLPLLSLTARESLVDQILAIADDAAVETCIGRCLEQHMISDEQQVFLTKALAAKLKQYGFLKNTESYWQALRRMLFYMIGQNIRKAYLVQSSNQADAVHNQLDHLYAQLDFSSILENQNKAGSDSEKGFIWILNTSVIFCAEYKFFWEIN